MNDQQAVIDEKVHHIMEIVQKNYPGADVSIIEKAYKLADQAHGHQLRRSGERYIIHPVAVAYMLAQYHMDVDTVAAALLHDVIEDTPYTYEDIAREFNDQIAYMVDGVTKITRLNYQSKEESEAEYIRKMVISMSNDIRIIMIKLVDRLHNMRTLEYMSTAKQIEKSRETLDIYAPIANRLGIQSIKAELEDLALKYLEPDAYYDLVRKVNMKKQGREEFINKITKILEKKIADAGIKDVKIYGRSKHLYSIYRKMKKAQRDFNDIYDLFAVRVIVDSVQDCYSVLGIIHTLWNPIPGRFKDYIAMPKANNYQSIHTTVIGPNGNPFEIQIRTHDMHEIAEYGIAAHWKYKEGKGQAHGREKRYEAKMAWLRQMIDWSPDFDNANEFLETMKSDMLKEEVYVFTPAGKPIELPAGSCPIDFAYRIHTDIGNTCVGAKVNGKIVPLNYILNQGDIVEIKTSKASHGPSRDWLSFVKSAHSRNKIRQYFKREEKEENIQKGRALLDGEIKKLGLQDSQLLSQKVLTEVNKALKYRTLDDFYVSLGVGQLRLSTVLQKMELLFPDEFPKEEENVKISAPKRHRGKESSVVVAGYNDIDVHFARCCSPVPGDNIVGYITVGKGISVHRADCPNVNHVSDTSRLIEVEWNKNRKIGTFAADIEIKSYEKQGGLIEVSKPFYDLNIPIIEVNTKTVDGLDFYNFKCEVKSVRDLTRLLKEIRKIPEVISAVRS